MPLFGGGKAKKEEQARQEARKALTWGGVDRSRLHDKAVEAIDQAVVDGERVIAIVPGVFDQAIIATTHRVYVYKKGMMAGASGGEKMAGWDYRAIYGVQMEMGRVSGFVSLQTPGSETTDTSYWSNDKNAPARAVNAIPIVKDKKLDYPALIRDLRMAIDAHRAPGH